MANTRDSVDLVTRGNALGSLDDAYVDLMYGFNNGILGNPVPYNTENQGLTFFTRPRLNLTYDNLASVREMMPLAVEDPTTIQAAIRGYLDPAQEYQRTFLGSNSALMDQECAFIPMLSNLLISLNGWPDMSVGTFTSKQGIYHETWSMVDDFPSSFYSDFELTANFRNVRGDPITQLLFHWVLYQSHVYTGRMMPYPDSVINNEIDYVTRIYRITLDETKRYVQKIGACGYAFPLAAPIGASMDFSNDTPMNMNTAQQLSTSFKCSGFMWNDPLLIYMFNRTVGTFNRHMRSHELASSSSLMVELTPAERDIVRGRAYPRIDPRTFEMKWYAYRSDFDAIISAKLPDTIQLPKYGLQTGE